MDENDMELGDRDDEEIHWFTDLITSLDQDVREFRHAYFQMRREWLVGRDSRGSSGVVTNQELSLEQICDDIENHPNHPDLLKYQ